MLFNNVYNHLELKNWISKKNLKAITQHRVFMIDQPSSSITTLEPETQHGNCQEKSNNAFHRQCRLVMNANKSYFNDLEVLKRKKLKESS
jgi:hypothetical protein